MNLYYKFLLGICGLLYCATSYAEKFDPLFSDSFNSPKEFKKNWKEYNPKKKGKINLELMNCDSDNLIVKISSDEKTSQGIKHTVSGLDPEKIYRVSAKIKTSGVEEGRGAVLYVAPKDEDNQPWNASEFVYGDTDWKKVYMDFAPDAKGKADIVLGLGFPWETYNGGLSKGTVYWDDVMVSEVPDGALKIRNSKHVTIAIDSEKVSIDDAALDKWLAMLDTAYESYEKLVGEVTYGGKRLIILTTPGIEPGYWALAGNPILWNNHADVKGLFEKSVSNDDWGFGIVHEIGHVFNAGTVGKSGNWNWNDEIFANFRMSYALEKNNGVMSQNGRFYKGPEVIDYYKLAYDKTIGAGIASDNGDAFHYLLLRIKEKFGWEVYEKAFRTLYALGRKDISEKAPTLDKVKLFFNHVSKAANEDVLAATCSPEEIKLIYKGFEK